MPAKRKAAPKRRGYDQGGQVSSGYRFTPPPGSSTADYYRAYDPTSGYQALKRSTSQSGDTTGDTTGKARGGKVKAVLRRGRK